MPIELAYRTESCLAYILLASQNTVSTYIATISGLRFDAKELGEIFEHQKHLSRHLWSEALQGHHYHACTNVRDQESSFAGVEVLLIVLVGPWGVCR